MDNTETMNAEVETTEISGAQAAAAAILAKRAKKASKSTDGVVAEKKASKSTDGVVAEKKVREPKAPKVTGKIGYRFKRDIDDSIDKMNAQQRVLIEAMLKIRKTEGEAKDVVLRSELLSSLTSEDLKSRQTPERVFGFYLNGWKKDAAATEKKPAVPALLEVVKLIEA